MFPDARCCPLAREGNIPSILIRKAHGIIPEFYHAIHTCAIILSSYVDIAHPQIARIHFSHVRIHDDHRLDF